MRAPFRFAVAPLLLLNLAGCASVPLRAHQSYRRAQYFASRPELTPTIAKAIESGHVVEGMDQVQVWVVLGDPVRKSAFSVGHVEIWLYPSNRFHQDPTHSHGATSFRLIFIDGILRVIEPL